MAARLDLEIVGFDRDGVDVHIVREIASALEDLVTRYPIRLGGIEISERREDAATIERAPSEESTLWVVLDRADLSQPPAPTTTRSRWRWPGRRFAERAIRTAVVREYARVLDRAGGLRARDQAWQTLLTESLRGGRSTYGLLDPAQALVEGFTEVELRGNRAGATAKLLHDALTKAASWRNVVPPDQGPAAAQSGDKRKAV